MLEKINHTRDVFLNFKKQSNLSLKGLNIDEETFTRQKSNELQISIKSYVEIPNSTKLAILDTISQARDFFKKTPDEVVIKNLYTSRGNLVVGKFNVFKPRTIQLSPNASIAEICIHEIAHQNDLVLAPTKLPFVGKYYNKLSNFTSKMFLKMNKKMVSSQLGDYATRNRAEFVAETARVLICEKKNWSDLNPRIKSLYKIFLGPRIRII